MLKLNGFVQSSCVNAIEHSYYIHISHINYPISSLILLILMTFFEPLTVWLLSRFVLKRNVSGLLYFLQKNVKVDI